MASKIVRNYIYTYIAHLKAGWLAGLKPVKKWFMASKIVHTCSYK